MRLELRHRDDDVGLAQHLRHPELAEAGVPRSERYPDDRRVVEVDELRAPRRRERRGARTATTTASVSRRWPGPSPTTTERGAEAPKRVRGRDDEPRVRVDRRVAEELDEVRLEQHRAAAHVRLDEPEPVEQQALEIAVVALGAQDGDGRAAGLGIDRPVERRRPVEGPEPLGDERRRRAPTHAAAAPDRTSSWRRVRLMRATSAARAAASGAGREHRPGERRAVVLEERRALARSPRAPSTAAAASSSTPWSRNATSACATVRPPARGATPPKEVEPDADERLRLALKRDQRDRSRLRVAGSSTSSTEAIAVVPAAVRRTATPRAGRSPRGARRASAGVSDVARDQHPSRRLDERPHVGRPSPARGARVRRSGERKPPVRDREAERASPAPAPSSARAASAAVVGPPTRPSELAEAAIGALPRLSQRVARRIPERQGGESGRLDLGLAVRRSSRNRRQSADAPRSSGARAAMEALQLHAPNGASRRRGDSQFVPRSSPD